MRRAFRLTSAAFLTSVRYHSTRYFTHTDEWMEYDNGIATVGITTHARESLGDVVYIQLPDVGEELDAEKACCEVESVKATSRVYSPVKGVVDSVNQKLVDDLSPLNSSPESEGWLIKVKCSEIPKDLMTFDQYDKFIKKEE